MITERTKISMKQPVNVRIDERLIHGQVAALWAKELLLERIIIIDNEIIHDPTRKLLLKTACPSTIKLSIISVKKAVENIKNKKYQDERCMILVRWPETLEQLGDEGIYFDEVCIGNMPNKPGTKMITNQIFVSEKQRALFKKLSEHTHFIVWLVPNSNKQDFLDILENQK